MARSLNSTHVFLPSVRGLIVTSFSPSPCVCTVQLAPVPPTFVLAVATYLRNVYPISSHSCRLDDNRGSVWQFAFRDHWKDIIQTSKDTSSSSPLQQYFSRLVRGWKQPVPSTPRYLAFVNRSCT
ncbi:hypothetical protein BDQ17DRAFT_826801 [Cyathus striatus]|nr:hypothetical protein BDQ17DRAFT_826801 [Cyathus striatus]